MSDNESESSDVELSEEEPSPVKAKAAPQKGSLKGISNLSVKKFEAAQVLAKHPDEMHQAEGRHQKIQAKLVELRNQMGLHQEDLNLSSWKLQNAQDSQVRSPFSGRDVLVAPSDVSDPNLKFMVNWRVEHKDWNTGLYLLKPDVPNQTSVQDLWLPRSKFRVLAQPGDQVSVVYTVEVPRCAEAPAPATAQPAAAEAAATEQPAAEQAAPAPNPDEAATAPDAAAAAVPAEGQNAKMEDEQPPVPKFERKEGWGMMLQRDGADVQVRLQDGQVVTTRIEHATVHLEEWRFNNGAMVADAQGLGRINVHFKDEGVPKVQVAFQSGEVKVLEESQLMSEKAWWSYQVDKAKSALEKVQARLPEAEEELKKAVQTIVALHEAWPFKQKAYDDAAAALSKVKHSNVLHVQTLVSFKRGKARPKVWRDISNYVELQWVVCVNVPPDERLVASEDPDIGVVQDQRERPVILTLADCKSMAQSVLGCRDAGREHTLTAKGQKLNRCVGAGKRKGAHLMLTQSTAKRILKLQKAKAAAPAPLHSFSLLKAALGVVEEVVLDDAVQAFFDSPEIGLIRAKEVPPPEQLKDVLRPYQLSGYHWLVNNVRNGLGCILADDMGLGKTLQAIALMLYMKQNGMLTKPMLVVVPKGLLGTWQKELKRWADDSLSVHCYVGAQRQLLPGMVPAASSSTAPPQKMRRLNSKQNAKKLFVKQPKVPKVRVAEESKDVFLTSYGTFRSNVKALSVPGAFSGMLLDEAQQIKNYSTQISKAVKEVAEHVGQVRISLSGTPVENKLQDLHSQFEYILPGYLSSSRVEFQRNFAAQITRGVRRTVRSKAAEAMPDVGALVSQERLRRLVAPFLMRRLKGEVAKDLPSKVEQDQECELCEHQKRIYVAIQEQCLHETTLEADRFKRHAKVLTMLHALREVCGHPSLVSEKRLPASMVEVVQHTKQPPADSGKVERLMELLDGIVQGGEKVLIFSNYLNTIAMLQKVIQQRFNKEVLKIVGEMGIPAREATVEKFQNDADGSYPVMLLSLKAGGEGLTLTAATHVIHFDRQYNPAKEAQATDRAHRIGQKKTVFVHKLICKDTFEEKLNAIMQEKQQLSDVTVRAGEDWIADLNDAQLRDLFSLGS